MGTTRREDVLEGQATLRTIDPNLARRNSCSFVDAGRGPRRLPNACLTVDEQSATAKWPSGQRALPMASEHPRVPGACGPVIATLMPSSRMTSQSAWALEGFGI
jgi:hypothetical protein